MEIPAHDIGPSVAKLMREEWGRMIAALVSQFRDIELAEDVLQDAFEAAMKHWPRTGVPDHAFAWILQAARNKAIDRFRRERTFEDKRRELEENMDTWTRDADDVPDERLGLVFMCCHPALSGEARVALTLRTVGGLMTDEIARAFLVSETTMAQRLVRAKRKIKAANIPFRVPGPDIWSERLDSVLAVIYLIFNEGYAPTHGPRITRTDLCLEAIRLGRIMTDLLPGEGEVAGLTALMLLHDSRRPARSAGGFVSLDEQDRSLWNRDAITEGTALLRRGLESTQPGRYGIQAAISAVHARAAEAAETDWGEIVSLYRRLYAIHPSPVVKLNEIVALSRFAGVLPALEALRELEDEHILNEFQPFHATRGDLLRRAHRNGEAAVAYERALDLTENEGEREFLRKRLLEVSSPN